MRPSILSSFLRRHGLPIKLRPQRPRYTSHLHDANSKPTATQPFQVETYLESSRQKFTSQPPTIIPDILSSTHSHLLTLSLADHVPSMFPPDHQLLLSKRSLLPSIHHSLPPPDEKDLVLPQGHHLVYFPLQLPPSQLMPDGTDPAHWPGPPFVRRMWAGGRVVFREGWRELMRMDGRRVVCIERVVPDAVEVRTMKSAGVDREEKEEEEEEGMERVFVDVQRLYGAVPVGKGVVTDEEVGRGLLDGKGVAVEEARRLVFMRERRGLVKGISARKVIKATAVPEFTFPLKPDNTLLFHFSALTYNAHAIHIDPYYARYREGYPGLLVHGPLTLVLMLSALRAALVRLQSQAWPTTSTPEQSGWMPSVKSITYRNLAPLFSNEDMRVCLRRTKPKGDDLSWHVWVEGPEGGIAVKGHAVSTGVVRPS
ncbi:hypothetical protein N657DRAFT_664277 [Parathielavia appendiculata]|uniref:Hydroxyacyl-thioester dehydratase type 2, mitochondrial n=1 Tax=Parathielavia appendiculata TaxID=2587402 RepID=A0AAN6TZM8_9PEZI|nr:hypothetical protein N657DRAFT_664277 [Parathielavia appendiculata]